MKRLMKNMLIICFVVMSNSTYGQSKLQKEHLVSNNIRITNIKFAYENKDSLVFYADIDEPLICLVSLLIYFNVDSNQKITNIQEIKINQILPLRKNEFAPEYRNRWIDCNNAKTISKNKCICEVISNSLIKYVFTKKRFESFIIKHYYENKDEPLITRSEPPSIFPQCRYPYRVYLYPFPLTPNWRGSPEPCQYRKR